LCIGSCGSLASLDPQPGNWLCFAPSAAGRPVGVEPAGVASLGKLALFVRMAGLAQIVVTAPGTSFRSHTGFLRIGFVFHGCNTGRNCHNSFSKKNLTLIWACLKLALFRTMVAVGRASPLAELGLFGTPASGPKAGRDPPAVAALCPLATRHLQLETRPELALFCTIAQAGTPWMPGPLLSASGA
jgi:hypothetical protein